VERKKGFTLAELLAVIAILAIIATIATTSVYHITASARKKASIPMRSNLMDVAITYVIDNYNLTKCSTDFSKQVFENNNISGYASYPSCAKLLSVALLKNEGLFKDEKGYCKDTDTVLVYRYYDGENSEYKAYVSDDACTNY
jgi:prepilin-type N-terminal cleavage/methylation domain-containing protein